MLRRTAFCLQRSVHSEKEKRRIKVEKTRAFLYDEQGNLIMSNYFVVLYRTFHKELKMLVAFLSSYVLYEIVVVKVIRMENQASRRLEKRSEDELRGTGKLRAERYLVKPQRFVEDPDYYDIPSASGPRAKACPLMVDDSFTAPGVSDRRGPQY